MILDLGLTDYEAAYKVQREFVHRRRLGEIEDSVIFTEHKPVFTIGRMGSIDNLLVGLELLEKSGIKVINVDRGGDITFHGPGQMVFYPIIDLGLRKKDLHQYLREIEESVIGFLSEYGITSGRSDGKTGVWVKAAKIASIGVAARDWITYHGAAVNLNVDLDFFSMINPCGMKDIEVTSLAAILKKNVNIAEAKEKMLAKLGNIFNLGEINFAERSGLLA